jgi:hypothetical protein
VSVTDLSAVASVLGLELTVGLYPTGEPLRDKGHQALIARLRAILSPAFRVMAEAPLPTLGDRRAWDLLLRLPQQLIGVEAETRIRDMQRLVRHMHERERDGGADTVLLVLADTRTNPTTGGRASPGARTVVRRGAASVAEESEKRSAAAGIGRGAHLTRTVNSVGLLAKTGEAFGVGLLAGSRGLEQVGGLDEMRASLVPLPQFNEALADLLLDERIAYPRPRRLVGKRELQVERLLGAT